VGNENNAADYSKIYFLQNGNRYSSIFDAYFTRLARQAILNGAGIVQLFKKQAEDTKVNGEFFVDSQHTMSKISCRTGDALSLFNPMGIVSGFGNFVSSALGQVVSTLKNGVGFVVGLVVPKSSDTEAPTVPPQEPPQDNSPLADTSDDISPDTEAATGADENLISTNTPVVAPPAPTSILPPRPVATTAATTSAAGTTQATTTATSSSTLVYAGGGGGSASIQNHAPVDDIAEDNPDEKSTSTAANSTSTEEMATSTDSFATSTEETATTTLDNATSTATTTDFAPPATDHVLISEILFDAEGPDTGKEFIELYNPADTSKNLTGYKLKYTTGNSTTTQTLAAVRAATSTEQPIIPARGFLLFGFGEYDSQNYGGITGDISRSASLPNGENAHGDPQKIDLGLYNETNAKIDASSYDKTSTPAPGYSLERMAWDGSVCISASSENEFLGNGCATGENQFESRQTPRPQNSLSLPEPREKPTTPATADGSAMAIYDPPTLSVNFSWAPSADATGGTSTILYALYDTSTSSPVLVSTTTTTTSSIPISQTGRVYSFGLTAKDRDGFSSATSSIDIEIPGLPPTEPENFTAIFDDIGIKLNLSWSSSTDSDSSNSEITYEINVSTSTELSSSTWASVDKSLSTQVDVSLGNSYVLGVRARDTEGNYSEVNILNWSFPTGFNPNLLTATSSNGNFTFVPRAGGVVGQITVTDTGGIYGACGNSQSRVQINGHSYPRTSIEGGSPKQYIYKIASSTENIYAGVPMTISWQGYFTYEPSYTQTQSWFNFGDQNIPNLMYQNYQRCQMPIATTTATLLGQ